MPRWLLILITLGDIAYAAPPSAYQCKPGTTKPGVGCACPAGYRDRRDGDNTAICYARTPPTPKRPPPKAVPAAPPNATGGKYKRVATTVAGADSPSSPQHSFFLAEQEWVRAVALDTAAGWETAANAFTTAVRTNKLDPKIEKEALYASVLAWKNALATDVNIKTPPPPTPNVDRDSTAPTPIPANEAKMVAAFELYLTRIKDPRDPEVPGMKFLKANIYRRHNRLDEAITMFREILKQHIDAEVAEYAASLAIDSLVRLGRFPEMLALTDELLANPGFLADKDELHSTLIKLKRTGLAKRAMALEAQGTPAKAVECGKVFIEQYNADPEGYDNDMTLYNAMVCFEKGEAWASSLKVFAVFEHHFAKSSLFPKTKAMAAIAKTKLGN